MMSFLGLLQIISFKEKVFLLLFRSLSLLLHIGLRTNLLLLNLLKLLLFLRKKRTIKFLMLKQL